MSEDKRVVNVWPSPFVLRHPILWWMGRRYLGALEAFVDKVREAEPVLTAHPVTGELQFHTDDELDVTHLRLEDGRCVVSVNGQGRLPCSVHTVEELFAGIRAADEEFDPPPVQFEDAILRKIGEEWEVMDDKELADLPGDPETRRWEGPASAPEASLAPDVRPESPAEEAVERNFFLPAVDLKDADMANVDARALHAYRYHCTVRMESDENLDYELVMRCTAPVEGGMCTDLVSPIDDLGHIWHDPEPDLESLLRGYALHWVSSHQDLAQRI